MAIKDLITPGIGFAPGSVSFIITRGLGGGAESPPTSEGLQYTAGENKLHYSVTDNRLHYTAPTDG